MSRRRMHQAGSRGQALSEMIITGALIAIATVGVTTLFGNNIRAAFGMQADALAGTTHISNRGQRSNATIEKKNLGNFASNGNAATSGNGCLSCGPGGKGSINRSN